MFSEQWAFDGNQLVDAGHASIVPCLAEIGSQQTMYQHRYNNLMLETVNM